MFDGIKIWTACRQLYSCDIDVSQQSVPHVVEHYPALGGVICYEECIGNYVHEFAVFPLCSCGHLNFLEE
jgi:hypothetical protein